jgi:hypothetical protein
MILQHGVRMTAVAVAAIGVFAFGGVASAADPASLEIHKLECETGVGAAIFEECHDNRVEDVYFNVDLPTQSTIPAYTDEDGIIAVGLPETGTIGIYESGADAGDYIGVYAYCRDLTSDRVLFDGALTADAVEGYYFLPVTVTEGMEVVCDWYNITEAGELVPGPSHLPSTGVGSGYDMQTPLGVLMATGLLALAGAAAMRRHAA